MYYFSVKITSERNKLKEQLRKQAVEAYSIKHTLSGLFNKLVGERNWIN